MHNPPLGTKPHTFSNPSQTISTTHQITGSRTLATRWTNDAVSEQEGSSEGHERFGYPRTIPKDQFRDLTQRRRPDVIVIGGFLLNMTKLSRVKETVGKKPLAEQLQSWSSDPPLPLPKGELNVPVIYAQDHSKRAEEFSALSTITRYCIHLARYVQSPLNEYAALGSDITAISFDEDCQQLVRFTPLESLRT